MAKKYIDADLLRKEIKKRMLICDGVFERDSDTYYQGKAVAYQETLSFIDSLQQEQPDAEALKREWWNKGYYEGRKNAHIPAKELGLPKAWDFQQEQSCDTCTDDKGCVTCKDGELWEGKPEVDLEKEIEKFLASEDSTSYDNAGTYKVSFKDPIKIARHFYILGLKNNIPVTQITLEELAKEGEPVSKDLEKEIQRYLREECSSDDEPSIGEIARHFANWQKEQMLKDAVEASVNYYENIPGGSYVELVADILNPTGVRYKDKVKIVIVKED